MLLTASPRKKENERAGGAIVSLCGPQKGGGRLFCHVIIKSDEPQNCLAKKCFWSKLEEALPTLDMSPFIGAAAYYPGIVRSRALFYTLALGVVQT